MSILKQKKKIDSKKKEVNDLSNKFRELKSLVYDYKEKKEKEIEDLNKDQINFKNEIEKNKENFENILEEAAEKIEKFVQKTNSDNSIQ